jgi:PAS domain S-box-containing protein
MSVDDSIGDWLKLGPHKLLEEAPLAVLVVNDQGKIVFANRMAVTLFGYSRAEFVGKEIHFLVPSDRRAPHANFIAGWFKHPRARPMGADLGIAGQNKNGDLMDLNIQLSPVEADAGVLAVAWIEERTRP